MTTVGAAPHHRAPKLILKATASTLLLLATAGGVWHGSQAVAAHFLSVPSGDVSFASTDSTKSMLQEANHSPATKGGSFLPTASLHDSDVQGIRVDNGE